ncbi:methionyl-tRNA formyltransferase [Natranaerofaba carboxydovora]|uniref:methionyl-tRNA formyltransferase n=1 Tax=Natranaerofaba carboxydovora TaxID=2742683 RepID=UPI001F14169C|nr:methionyl-tRNA formyltransferase [Natranaerofaba carboxydovora]UMZ73297.1 Methionyl-tRNA formyltransferase [Natranaerofaba carboxydovora]
MSLNIIFMGTPEFAVPTLNALIDSEHNLELVVTQPDKPKGRGQKTAPTPVKENCLEREITVYQPDDLKDELVYNRLKELKPDLIVTMAYGKLIPGKILELPEIDCINVHASLLPKYRGAAPIHWAVINGEKETGITIMSMDEGMDTGDILSQEKVPIHYEDTTGDVHDKLKKVSPKILLETIKKIEQGEITQIKQDEKKATIAPKLTKEYLKINWENEDAGTIYNKIRGLNPWPVSYTYWQNKRLRLWESKNLDDSEIKGVAGEIIRIDDDGPVVQCQKGLITLTCLQPEGKKKLKGNDFLRGYSMEMGEVLG